MKFFLLAMFILKFSFAAEVSVDCRSEILFSDFYQDESTGCFLETYDPESYIYAFQGKSVAGDKLLTRELAKNSPTSIEDLLENKHISFYDNSGKQTGSFWPYASAKKINENKYYYGFPAFMSVDISPLPLHQKRVTFTTDKNVKLVILCKETPSADCANPSINSSSMPKAGPPKSIKVLNKPSNALPQ